MAIKFKDGGELFRRAKGFITGGSLSLFEDEEKRRKREEEERKLREEISRKIERAKDVGRKALEKVGEIPTFAREEPKVIRPAYERKGLARFLGPEVEPVERIPLKEFFAPKEKGLIPRRKLAETIETSLGGLFFGFGPQATTAVKAGLSVKQALATGGIFGGITAGLRKLRGEPIEPKETALAFGVGAAFGFAAPRPMAGLATTELGAARRRLADYGFSLKDEANPTVLRSKFNQTVKVLHPDVGGDAVKFDQFIKDFRAVTSAEAPRGLDVGGLRNWVSTLWRKKKEPVTGREIIPTPKEAVPSAKIQPIVPPKVPFEEGPTILHFPQTKGMEKLAVKLNPEEVSLFRGFDRLSPKQLEDLGLTDLHLTPIKTETLGRVTTISWDEMIRKVPALEKVLTREITPPIAEFAPPTTLIPDVEALRIAKPGKGQFLPGEVYDQDLDPLGVRRVLIQGRDEEGNILGWYLPDKESAKLLGQREAFLQPAKFTEPSRELQSTSASPENIKTAVNFLFGKKPEALLKEPQPEVITPAPKRITITQIERAKTQEEIDSILRNAPTQTAYVKGVIRLLKMLDKPEVQADRRKIRMIRAIANDQIEDMTGYKGSTGHWKQDFALLKELENDPVMADALSALYKLIARTDDFVANQMKKGYEVVERDLNLPPEGDFYVPYGKYTTHGTGNREWVQQNIPLIYMGNKRGMVGSILDVLGITQRDLPSIVPSDVKHLNNFKRVIDLFGGSGLLSNLSKKFFPNAKITYNELDPRVIDAIQLSQKKPAEIRRFISEIAVWLNKNPGADWLSHFSLVYKGDKTFMVAARLIDATAGRVDEVTPVKLTNLLKAVNNFSKIFKDVDITQKDAMKIMDTYIRSGSVRDLLWIDPPYLWSAGYQVGSEFEKTKGFLKLLDKLESLNKKGVKFVFFNNDPAIQVSKAGTESIYLDNINGRINQLSHQGMVVVRGIKPVGTSERYEMIITNLDFGVKTQRLLSQKATEEAIAKLREDPQAGSRAVLTLLRNIRGTSAFVPTGERITAGQVKTIQTLRKRLKIRNREMIPVLDELLGDTSFAKMTKEDGIRMIEWLQPRNWDVIENQIAQTREMLASEKRQAAIGERVMAKNADLDKRFGAVSYLNEIIRDIDDFGRLVDNLPPVTAEHPGVLSKVISLPSMLAGGEHITAELLNLDITFYGPLLSALKISEKYQNAFGRMLQALKSLPKEKRSVVINRSAGVKTEEMEGNTLAMYEYLQDFGQKVGETIVRLQKAAGDRPMNLRDPYWPYILDANLAEAAGLPAFHKPQEQRLSTPEDFTKDIFSKDFEKVIDLWSRASSSMMRKLLFKIYVKDRFDDILREGDAFQRMYVKAAVNFDILGQLPDWEYALREVGREVNRVFGKLTFPKKVPLSKDQKDFLSNSTSLELRTLAEKGYISVPRFEIPNVGNVYSWAFITAKLFSNFLFISKNLMQQFQALPFVGIPGYVEGLGKWVNVLLPQNKIARHNMQKTLNDSGYHFGRMAHAVELPEAKAPISRVIETIATWQNSFSEYIVRTINDQQAIARAKAKARKGKFELPDEETGRVGAEFSAFINYLSGKGRSPFLQRTTLGKPFFIFMQYPTNTIWKVWQMLKYALSDKYAARTWQRIAASSYSPEAFKMYEEMPNDSKARFFLIPLAFALSAAIVYQITQSWRAATDTLPGKPRITEGDVIAALAQWWNNPTDETARNLRQAVLDLTPITFVNRFRDAYGLNKYGMITNRRTGRPIFIEPTVGNVTKTALFGRGVLKEYEKAYPSFLGEKLGGYTEAGKAEALATERKGIQDEETRIAVDLFKKLQTDKSFAGRRDILMEMQRQGKLKLEVTDKLKDFFEEQTRRQGPLEKKLIGLKDEDQARFILDELQGKNFEEKRDLLQKWTSQGILTENVIKEMKQLSESGYKKKEENVFQRFFPF